MTYVMCSCGKIFHYHRGDNGGVRRHLREKPFHHEQKRWSFDIEVAK